MSKHKIECRDKMCQGCGQESDMAKLKVRIDELETEVQAAKLIGNCQDQAVAEAMELVTEQQARIEDLEFQLEDCARQGACIEDLEAENRALRASTNAFIVSTQCDCGLPLTPGVCSGNCDRDE